VSVEGSGEPKQESCLPEALGVRRRAPDRWYGRGRLAVVAVLCGLTTTAFGQPLVLEMHTLRYRSVEQVLPVIRPLVPPPGTVSGLQNQLVVRAPPAVQADIRAVLERIDAAPRRLLISVRHDDSVEARAGGATAQGQVVLGRAGGASVDLRLQDGRANASGQGVHQIQVLEGQPAMIRSGQSAPVPVRQTIRGPDGVTRVIDSLDYRETGSSVQVLPRLAGEQVILDILPERGEPGPSGTVAVQRLATQVSGRLGEWIELGGIVQESSAQQSGLLGSTSRAGREARRTWVRVEELR
jgi:hypothetical protein